MPLKHSRKFLPISSYQNTFENFYLLPFRFQRINNKKEILVNEIGDFLIYENGTARRIVNKEIDKSEKIYSDLIAHFFISEKSIPDLIDLIATRYRTKKSFLDNFTTLHIFVITLRCNHKCSYCQVSRQSQENSEYDISLENLDKSINLMFMSPSKNLTVEFQGGEPLLAFEKVQYAVKKISEINIHKEKNITIVLCTNLSIISEDILNFCKEYKILISTSLDGPDYIHNANRPSLNLNSYKILKDNLKRYRASLGRDQISGLMTTSEISLNYPIQIIDEYLNNGFSSIFIRAINPYGLAKKYRKLEESYIHKFIEFYKIALLYIIELNMRGTYFVEEYANIILSKMLTPFPIGFTDLQSPNGVINSVVVFNYDGYVYASDESRMLAEEGDFQFRLGHVQYNSYKEIFYGEKAKNISQYWSNESLPGCSECAFIPYCGADPVRNYTTQSDMVGHRPSSIFCKKNFEIIRFLIELMSENKEIEKIFRSWVNKII